MQRAELITGEGQPGGREPAPGDLRIVQDLVNSVDRENVVDILDGVEGARAWLAHRGHEVTVGPADVRRMVTVREALRTLLRREGELEPAAELLQRVGRVRLDFAGPALVPEPGGVDGVLAGIAGSAFLAMVDGRWTRLKACPRSVCHWAFYDRSPNGRSTWCSMEVCGNRTKVAAHHRRVSRR